jgi:uncharacterized protein Usg
VRRPREHPSGERRHVARRRLGRGEQPTGARQHLRELHRNLRQLQGFSLTTAEILYRLPDYPRLLQSYIWQDYDVAPEFPQLVDFLDYWAANLDGPLYRVRVAHRRLIVPQEFRFVSGELRLN